MRKLVTSTDASEKPYWKNYQYQMVTDNVISVKTVTGVGASEKTYFERSK